MTPTLTPTKVLDTEAVKHLAEHEGPCVSVFLPARRPGSPDTANAPFIRAALREFPDLLHSVDDLMEKGNGGGGLAIFASRTHEQRYKLPHVESPLAVVSNHFHLTPILAIATSAQDLYVLDVNRKKLRLIHIVEGEGRPAALPEDVPENMEAAGVFAQHSHDLANRAKSGAGQTVHFGKETEREAGGEYLHHFFTQVDRNLTPVLNGRPLILAGVHEELTAYRRAARYPSIFTSEIHGNTALLSLDEVESCVMMAVREEHQRAGELVLLAIREINNRGRQKTGVREVCEAAAQGRVHQLCVAEGAEEMGHVPGAKPSWTPEDLVNAAAVFTLRAGGSVYMLPPERMKEIGPVAAILRY